MHGSNERGISVNAFEILLGLLVSKKLGVKFEQENGTESDRFKEIKDSIIKSIDLSMEKKKNRRKPKHRVKKSNKSRRQPQNFRGCFLSCEIG